MFNKMVYNDYELLKIILIHNNIVKNSNIACIHFYKTSRTKKCTKKKILKCPSYQKYFLKSLLLS